MRDAIKQRLVSPEDGMSAFVDALYEIQRGYYLSETNVDNGLVDNPICTGGTFNKFIEKLQGIDPDCEIRLITHEVAALKLPMIVKSEMAN